MTTSAPVGVTNLTRWTVVARRVVSAISAPDTEPERTPDYLAGYDEGYQDGLRDGNEQAFDGVYCSECRDYH